MDRMLGEASDGTVMVSVPDPGECVGPSCVCSNLKRGLRENGYLLNRRRTLS